MALKQLERGDCDIIDLGAEVAKLARKAYHQQEDTVDRLAIEAFVCVLDPKLALKMQKLGYRSLDDVIAAAHRIKCLQKDYPSHNMENLLFVLQDEVWAVYKELKESAAAFADKAVWVVQPVVAPPAPTEAAVDNRCVAPWARMHAPQCRHRCFLCDQEDHFVVSCPISAEMFRPMQQEGRNSTPPAMPPISPAEGVTDDDVAAFLN